MILFLKDNGGEFWVDLIYDFAYEWSQVGPGVDRESYDIFTYQRKESFMARMKWKVSLGSREWLSLWMSSGRAGPCCIAKQSNKRQCYAGMTGSMPCTFLLGHLGRLSPVSFAKVICQLMREAGVLSISLFPFLPRGCLVTCDLHCMFWEPFHWSLRIFRIYPSIWFCIFLVGLFHTFSSSLFFCPLPIACFSAIHLTAMMDFKNWLLILTSRTQPRTLNQPSLHSTVAPPICHSSPLLYPPSALTWPRLASSRVVYNTEHSIHICYIKQKQWLDSKQNKHNGTIMWHIAEDKMDPSSIGEVIEKTWPPAEPWARPGQLEAPYPSSVLEIWFLVDFPSRRGYFKGHSFEMMMWCWKCLDGIHDWIQLRHL